MKKVFGNVKSEIAEHQKQYVVLMLWCIFSIGIGIWSNQYIYQNYQIALSGADLLILLQDQWELGIKIVPFLLLVVMKSKGSEMNMQFLTRYQSRRKLFRLQVAESAVYAALFSVIFVAVITIVTLMFRIPLVNWDNNQSLFCANTEWMIETSYWKVAVLAGGMCFIKILIDCIVLDIFMWYPKWMILFWIFLIIQAAIEIVGFEKAIFYQFFNIQYGLYGVSGKHGGILIIGMLVVLLEYLAGRLLIEKRDFYR